MPVIRYRTRDLTRLLPGTHSVMRRMDRIRGRSDDMMIIRGVNVFPTQIEELVLRCEGLAPHVLIELSRPGRMDEMKVLVEARNEAELARGQAHGARLAGLIKDVIGVSVSIAVGAPGSTPRSGGKRQQIRDLRGGLA